MRDDYLINAEYCFEGPELIKKRNILFTSLTRSKGWVRVYGVGEKMLGLIEEFKLVQEKNFKLDFRYPTIPEMEKLNVLHRDLSEKDKKVIIDAEDDLKSILSKFTSGEISMEFMSKDIKEQLKNLLGDQK